ncbi:hypothetical protein YC2023_068229 [Brassica napus]
MACFDLSKLSGICDAVPLATVPPLHPPQHQSKRFLSLRLALLAGESKCRFGLCLQKQIGYALPKLEVSGPRTGCDRVISVAPSRLNVMGCGGSLVSWSSEEYFVVGGGSKTREVVMLPLSLNRLRGRVRSSWLSAIKHPWCVLSCLLLEFGFSSFPART